MRLHNPSLKKLKNILGFRNSKGRKSPSKFAFTLRLSTSALARATPEENTALRSLSAATATRSTI